MEQRIADIKKKFAIEHALFQTSLETVPSYVPISKRAIKDIDVPSATNLTEQSDKPAHRTPIQLNALYRHVDNLNKNNLRKQSERVVPVVGNLGDDSDDGTN